MFPFFLPMGGGSGGSDYRPGGWKWIFGAFVWLLACLAFVGWLADLMISGAYFPKAYIMLPAIFAWVGAMIAGTVALIMRGFD